MFFGLHTAYVLKRASLVEEASKLSYFCLDAAVRLQDELLKAESLVMLYDLIDDYAGKQIVENLMIEHYHDTQYLAARHLMLSTFEGLKHVEYSEDKESITALYDDLLTFTRTKSA